ncbi:MAG: hypothetical protein WC632_01495, partial [Candidatus Margulisiibacteriota bacterium]
YWCKIDPKHITAQELQLLDLTPEELPCDDFHPDEILQHFVGRIAAGFNQRSGPAHDLPIYPRSPRFLMKFKLFFDDKYTSRVR